MSSAYLDQYHRVKRWYERFKSINETKEHNLPTDYYQDEVYAFFINCYHLGDWIKNDKGSQVGSGEVAGFIRNSEALKVCHDICIGSKHLVIREPKSDSNTSIVGRYFGRYLVPSPIIHIEYDIMSGSKVYDAFTIATQCMREWEKFLSLKKLL